MKCKDCEFNNNGWCKKYSLQKPQALKICNNEQEDYKIGDVILVSNPFRYFDIAVINSIYKSINDESLMIRIKSLTSLQFSVIEEGEIFGKIDSFKEALFNDYKDSIKSK